MKGIYSFDVGNEVFYLTKKEKKKKWQSINSLIEYLPEITKFEQKNKEIQMKR